MTRVLICLATAMLHAFFTLPSRYALAQCSPVTLLHTIPNPTPTLGDSYGWSVATDGNLIVVGAFGDDAGATDAGTAYVFNATTGALAATLSNPAPTASDWFGFSVAISGDMAVVGAYQDDAGAFNAGIAYVFNATTGALLTTLSNPARIGNILSNPPKCNKSNEKALG